MEKQWFADSLEELAQACYAFLTCEFLYRREVNLINQDIQGEPQGDHLFPEDLFSDMFTDAKIPDYPVFLERFQRCDGNAQAIGALDTADEIRAVMMTLHTADDRYVIMIRAEEGAGQKLFDRLIKRVSRA